MNAQTCEEAADPRLYVSLGVPHRVIRLMQASALAAWG